MLAAMKKSLTPSTRTLAVADGVRNAGRRLWRRKRTAGFTVMEVGIAAGIMAMVLISSIVTMQRGFLSLDTARNITIAGQIMQSEFEKMRLRDWSAIGGYAVDTDETVSVDPSFTSNAFIGNRFTMRRRVTNIDMGTGVGMRQITLTVTWTNYDGRVLSRSYTSYYGQNGLYDYFYNQNAITI